MTSGNWSTPRPDELGEEHTEPVRTHWFGVPRNRESRDSRERGGRVKAAALIPCRGCRGSRLNPAAPTPVVPCVRMQRSDDADITSLALRAGAGDRAAVAGFVRATQADVWRFVAHLAADAGLADDLTQETYLRALPSLPSFEGRSAGRTWLLAIARRVVADHIRAVQVRPRLHHSAEVPEPAEPGFADRVVLDEVIGSLDPERRTAFVLTQVLGLSYADAAVVCGCPVGTIRSRVARAREDLVGMLADDRAGRRIS